MPTAMLSTNFVAGVSHPAHTGENDGSNFCEGQLRRPSPWALVVGERNSAGDFHFLKSAVLSLAT
jgi:hypothetical protein